MPTRQTRLITRCDGCRDKTPAYGYTLAGLARLAGISRRTVGRMVDDGRLDPSDLLAVARWLTDPSRRARRPVEHG